MMKNLFTFLLLTVSFALFAQNVVNITYVTVPRQDSETFLELHKKFTNLSLGEERVLVNSGMFAHAFAGDYTYAIYDFYNSAEDLVINADISNKILDQNIKAMKLDEEAQAKMQEEYMSYLGMYIEGHSDQIRTFEGLEKLGFESEGMDWSTKKVVVLSKYSTKWGGNKDFTEGLISGSLKDNKDSGKTVAMYASRHLYGTGMDWHSYMFYETWSDFAAFEESSYGGSMDEAANKYWSSVTSHEDEILMWIGGIDEKTKLFYYAK